MGKILNILAAGSVVALSACAVQDAGSHVNYITVDAELSTSVPQTKTIMTEFNELWWSPKERMSVLYKSGDGYFSSVFISKNNVEAAETKFYGAFTIPEGTSLSEVSGIAIYPAADENSSSDGVLKVVVPDVQNAIEGTFAPEAYPVVAKLKSVSEPLEFKGICGGVKFAFQTAGIKSFTFKAADGAVIAGSVSVDFDGDGNPVATPLEGKTEITVNAPEGGFEPGKWYYMTALPVPLEGGFSMTSDGKTLVSYTGTVSINRAEFGVLDSKDAPDTYGDLKSNLKPVSWWDVEKDMIPAPAQAPMTTNDNRSNYVRGVKYVRFASDANYIYGYVEVDTEARDKWQGNKNLLDNLAIWVDADGVGTGQGGGWYLACRKGFEKAVIGQCASAYSPREWSPGLYSQMNVGANKGTLLETPAAPGYGEGEYDEASHLFKYSYVLDRRVLDIRNTTSVVLGITFCASWNNDYVICPDRGGYLISLNNTDNPVIDVTRMMRSMKDFSWWESVEAEKCTKDNMDKGNSIVKFASDKDFVYGYFEVNSDNLLYPENGFVRFNPAMLQNLAVGIDVDGISEGQGPGWMFSYKGYEVLLVGPASTSAITDAKGWSLSSPIVSSIKDATNYKDFGEDFPDYTLAPQVWIPKIYDMSVKADNWGKTILAGSENLSNFAAGKGLWNQTEKVFRYTFILDRNKLGIADRAELSIGVAFEYQYNGYVCIPSRPGFNIGLNN